MSRNYTGLFTTIASLTRSLSLSVLLFGSLISPSWGQVKKAEIVGRPSVDIDKEKVTIRIKATGSENKPVTNLEHTDFKLFVDGEPAKFQRKDWKNPEVATPPPAWIIVMLDYSGSMKEKDSSGTTKLKGAISAIQEFIKLLENRASNAQVVIVPFGDGPSGCAYPVTAEKLDNFFSANDEELSKEINSLRSKVPCASTDIYTPLTTAINFLSEGERFNIPEDSNEPQPRKSIILLSDGFHNQPNEQRDFNKLRELLKDSSDNITVHTFGYGLTPKQWQKKLGLTQPPTRREVFEKRSKVRQENFVDKERLEEIAEATGGISEFSPDAEEVAEQLEVFLKALLGEYEITYNQPNTERASRHDVKVQVKSIASETKSYVIPLFGRSVDLSNRLVMLLIISIVVATVGVVPFSMWASSLKRDA